MEHPPGVQDLAPALQTHDSWLLKQYIGMGSPSVIFKQQKKLGPPVWRGMAWQPKRRLQKFLPLCAHASVRLHARPC